MNKSEDGIDSERGNLLPRISRDTFNKLRKKSCRIMSFMAQKLFIAPSVFLFSSQFDSGYWPTYQLCLINPPIHTQHPYHLIARLATKCEEPENISWKLDEEFSRSLLVFFPLKIGKSNKLIISTFGTGELVQIESFLECCCGYCCR